LAIRAADPGALQLRQPMFELAAAVGQFQQALPPVLRAAMLDDEAAAQQLSQHTVQALFGDAENIEQFADRDVRVAADEMHNAVMRPAKVVFGEDFVGLGGEIPIGEDRKSTRLNSSHLGISYAVFCLKKKTQ